MDTPESPDQATTNEQDRDAIARLQSVEQFRSMQARVLEQVPGVDDVDIPQVLFVLDGIPAHLTSNDVKTYVTAFGGQMAVNLGKGLMEAGKKILREERRIADETAAAAPKILTATPAEAAHAARMAAAADTMRQGAAR